MQMSAYFVCEVKVTDPEGYEDYRHRVPPTIEKYGGRALIRGFTKVLEGGGQDSRMVIIEFDDIDTLKRWYESEDVKPLNELRQKVSKSHAVMIG
jgi:uncharacterized protein (DUF1330 family)